MRTTLSLMKWWYEKHMETNIFIHFPIGATDGNTHNGMRGEKS